MNPPTPFLKRLLGLSEEAFRQLEWSTIAFLGAYALHRGLGFVAQRWLQKQQGLPMGFNIRRHFGGSVLAWLFVIGLKGVEPLMELPPPQDAVADKVLSVLFIVAFMAALMRLVSLIKILIFSRLNVDGRDNLHGRKVRTQVQFIEKVIVVFMGLIAVSLVLMSFESVRKIGSSLIASAGLAGVVLGFAAQKSLANLLAGFQIAFTQPVRIDDVVLVEGQWGKIEEITLTYVIIRLWNKKSFVVPITYFIEKPFENWTRVSADVLGTVHIKSEFSLPLSCIRAELERILNATPLWDGVNAKVQITDSTEALWDIRLVVGARDANEVFDLRCLVREQMGEFLRNAKPAATLPAASITTSKAAPLPSLEQATRT